MAEKKRPKKGILKNSSSFDTQESSKKKQKETKWDEMNIIATLHPADKDYGHMKIEEPKTPYNYSDPENLDIVDAKKLAEQLRNSVDSLPKVMQEQESDDEDEEDADLTPEEREKRKEFKNKRKQHYNEFYAVKLARKLLEEEDEDDESAGASKSPAAASSSSSPSRSSPSPSKSPDKSPNQAN